MKNKNIIPLLLIAGVGYYFISQKKKKKGVVTLGPLEKSSIEEFSKAEVVPEEKPKTLFAKAAALVKKAASTPEGKSLIRKGVKAVTKKKQLKKMGADYLYY
jgi:hypothetical protein